MRWRSLAVAVLLVGLAAVAGAAPAAPGFRVKTLDGGTTLDSRTLIGKKVLVLRFQASYCKPCAREAEALAQLAARYAGRVEIWAIHVQDTTVDARAWVETHKPPYPVALDPKLTIGNRYGFKGSPYTVVVDRKGEIVWRFSGENAPQRLPRVLNEVLAGAAQPSRKL